MIMTSTVSPESTLSHEEVRRYSRHLLLEDVGVRGQLKLKDAKVMCVGSGGLGSPALMYLAAAGVGTIGLVDDDVVDESNLQRQIVHSTAAVGTSKVDSATQRMRDINPLITVKSYKEKLTSDNALRILADYDVVIDGCDNFPTRYLVNDACVILGKPLVYGAVQKFEGQVSVFNYKGGPNYRDMFPNPPPPGAVPSCAEGGILGVLPGVVGTMQATEAVKIVLGRGETLSGRLLLYDAMTMRFREVKIVARDDAPPITELIDYVGFCGQKQAEGAAAIASARERFARIGVAEANSRLQKGWEPFVLDVRSKTEANIVSLPFRDMLQPHRQMKHIQSQLPRDRDILVHCKTGIRSASACAALAEMGFERLYSLDGGINAWAREIDQSMPTY